MQYYYAAISAMDKLIEYNLEQGIDKKVSLVSPIDGVSLIDAMTNNSKERITPIAF